jgi:hypothetical protein
MPKGSSNFGSARVYLFVSAFVNPKSFKLYMECIESCHVRPRIRPSHQPTSVPKNLSKMEPNAERLVEFW